jgi:hypothetical protein
MPTPDPRGTVRLIEGLIRRLISLAIRAVLQRLFDIIREILEELRLRGHRPGNACKRNPD